MLVPPRRIRLWDLDNVAAGALLEWRINLTDASTVQVESERISVGKPLVTGAGSLTTMEANQQPVARSSSQPSVVTPKLSIANLVRPRSLRSPGRLSFFVLVVIPTLIASIYLLFVASHQYTSEFRVTVRSVAPLSQASGGLVSLLGLSGLSQTSTDSHAIVQYLQSRQAVEDISVTAPLRTLYSDPAIDWWSRLSPTASIEDVERYWSRMLDIYYESTTSTIVIRTSAFTPDGAKEIARGVLAVSEKLVNRLSERSRNDTVALADNAVTMAEARLTQVSSRLKALRDQEGILDPKTAAQTSLTLAAKLRGEISQANAELETQRKYLADSSPSVVQAKEHLQAMNNELARVNSEATSEKGTEVRPLSSVMGSFEQLENDRAFAEKAYQSALAGSETAKMEAARQQVYLATIVPPETPEDTSFPKPVLNIATFFSIAVAAWVILLFSYYAIREHM